LCFHPDSQKLSLCLLKPGILQILLIVFFTAVGIQLFYLIAFLIAFLKKRSDKDNPQVPVSVIVCAHDEEQNLRDLIPQLLAQEYPSFEIIIVNDRSNDGTYDFLLEETKKNPRLRMVHVDHLPAHVNGKKYGITLGIKAASSEWILLTDADCRPTNNHWIETMARKFDAQANFVLGISPYRKTGGFLNLFIRFESLTTAMQYLAFALFKNPYMGVGRNLAYRKSLFLEKKGFNQFLNVTGGDDDLFVNQHAKGNATEVQFKADAHQYSIPKTTWRSFYYQKLRHLSVGKRYRLKHRILLGAFGLTWVITWFTGVTILSLDVENWWVIGALGIRVIMLTIILRIMLRQAGLKFELWALLFLDFLYSIYYISTGLAALTTKKIRWTN
jgi:glycosyltransferase involved in cell wall biosynthesis